MTAVDTHNHNPPTTAIRRKPRITYKSPSGPAWGPFLQFIPSSSSDTTTTAAAAAESSPTTPPTSTTPSSPSKNPITDNTPRRIVSNPALPLYHPRGRLALSLPPLDPTPFGLPQLRLPPPQDDSGLVTAARRSGRAVSYHSDAAEHPAIPSVSSIAAVAAREMKDKAADAVSNAGSKERASPKKRRAGAGGGKRKRKSPDDGDPTYPAKRTRAPRGTQSVVADDDQGEAEPTDALPNRSASESNEVPDPIVRTTRSRAKRRDSSETSDAPQAREESEALPETASVADENGDKSSPMEKNDDDKEEGELSES